MLGWCAMALLGFQQGHGMPCPAKELGAIKPSMRISVA
jgi:hypothetical protein